LYMGFSFQAMSLCKVRFRPHGRPKGFPIALWKPSESHLLFRVVTCLLEERFFLCCLLKIAGRGQAEGVQGAIGKPPGCPGKDKSNVQNHPQNKNTPEILRDFRVMGQGSKTLAGCRGRAPAGVWGKAPQKGYRGQRPRLGVQRAKPFGGVWGKASQRAKPPAYRPLSTQRLVK